jgi:uncharacterized protein (DUF1778 family)
MTVALCAALVHNPTMAAMAQHPSRGRRKTPKNRAPVARSITGPNLRAQKTERLVARVSTEDKGIISQAAALAGQSVGSYILSEARKAALQTLESRQRIVLNAAQTRRMVELLLAPIRPQTERTKRALHSYRHTLASDVNA